MDFGERLRQHHREVLKTLQSAPGWVPTPIELYRDEVIKEHPDAQVELIPPLLAWGIWDLDINIGSKSLTITWHTVLGKDEFGVADINIQDRMFMGPDEVFESINEVKAWLERSILA